MDSCLRIRCVFLSGVSAYSLQGGDRSEAVFPGQPKVYCQQGYSHQFIAAGEFQTHLDDEAALEI